MPRTWFTECHLNQYCAPQLVICSLIDILYLVWLQYSHLKISDVDAVNERLAELLAAIRPNAVGIVDSFDFHDDILDSALGAYDGRVYERIFEAANKSPLNAEPVNESFHKYLKPFLKGQMWSLYRKIFSSNAQLCGFQYRFLLILDLVSTPWTYQNRTLWVCPNETVIQLIRSLYFKSSFDFCLLFSFFFVLVDSHECWTFTCFLHYHYFSFLDFMYFRSLFFHHFIHFNISQLFSEGILLIFSKLQIITPLIFF